MRRSRGGTDTGKKESSKKGNSDGPKKVVGKTKTEGKSASTMSDKQLRQVNNRLQMEKQYKDLTRLPPGKLTKAKSFVAGIAVGVAKQQITNLANEQASKSIATMMNRNIPKLPTKPLTGLPDITTRFTG